MTNDPIRALVDVQAADEGLWFVAETAPEAYLQQELRKLHAVIEAEARKGYVPASLSPEWHAELDFVAAEAVDAERARLRAAVDAIPYDYPEGITAFSGAIRAFRALLEADHG